jgi:acyl-coenzyme A synthetase/AMP-(fatty) acid ligase
VWFHAQRLKLGPIDRTLFLPSSTGIAGVLLILRTLLTGGTLVQFPGEHLSGQELSRVIDANGITSMTMVPSLFREMITSLKKTAKLLTPRTIILVGEPLTAQDVNHFQQHFGPECILLNSYGCTEIPTFRTYPIEMNTVIPWRQVPVGYEVEDKEVVLIDDEGKPVAHGDEGEIAVRSEFMARGYWRNPEETSRKFIPPHESGGIRMYRTGDRGYFLESGVLAFVGRRDQQVNVMGNRVELGEIENVLRQHPRVDAAAVITKDTPHGVTFLIAFVIAEEFSDDSETELRRFLLSRLPKYMIPARISNVASLPLTPNGKIDREALGVLEP